MQPKEKKHLIPGDLVVQGKVIAQSYENKNEPTSDEWVEKMKDVMVYNETTNEIEIGTHLYVDGDFETGDNTSGGNVGDIVVGHDIIIDSIANIQNPDGYSLFAPSVDAEDGTYLLKVVKSGTGFTFTWVKE